ncbi:MAG: hypothetical protein WEB05_02165 [Solirubrobacterales bacterium]
MIKKLPRTHANKRFTTVALATVLLALAALTVGAKSAPANSYNWGDNGSGACSAWSSNELGTAGAELGTYCMQSVTGWISIGEAASQQQAVSCANNAPGGSPGLSWSTDGQSYVNAGPWYELAYSFGPNGVGAFPAWQTGNGGDADLGSEAWYGSSSDGSNSSGDYGSGGAGVTNWGGSGGWQAAIACMNQAGTTQVCDNTPVLGNPACPAGTSSFFGRGAGVKAASVPIRDKTIDWINKAKDKAFLAREYALRKNVTRTATRTCPAGMLRKGKPTHTVQEFPANNKYSWKNRSLVDVKMTVRGKKAASIRMKLTRAKNPTVVQFQLRCGKPYRATAP